MKMAMVVDPESPEFRLQQISDHLAKETLLCSTLKAIAHDISNNVIYFRFRVDDRLDAKLHTLNSLCLMFKDARFYKLNKNGDGNGYCYYSFGYTFLERDLLSYMNSSSTGNEGEMFCIVFRSDDSGFNPHSTITKDQLPFHF
jgi:hypothetical protein